MSNGKITYDLIIYALRKFTGGLGDEDDFDREENDWQKYFLKDINKTSYVTVLQKANGEAAHMSCRYIDGNFIIGAGSKNVHLVFKDKKEISAYAEEKYAYARKIAEAIADHLASIDNELKNKFLSFLCWSKLTVIFEILVPDNMHIEDLTYLNNKPLLKFITFTENEIYEKPTSLCCMPPELAIEIGKMFEFSCVNCTIIKVNEVENYLIKVRNDYGYEGVVLYFLDSNSSVIGILKKKTTWYVILRAIREKLRSYLSAKSTTTLLELEKKVTSRLESIKKWIGFDDESFNNWKELSLEFVRWFDKNYRSNKISKEDHGCKFPVLWNQFIKETNKNDHIELKIVAQKQSVLKISNEQDISDDENAKVNEEMDKLQI